MLIGFSVSKQHFFCVKIEATNKRKFVGWKETRL